MTHLLSPNSSPVTTETLEKEFQNMDWNNRRKLVDGELLTHLIFVDYILLLSHNLEELNDMIQDVDRERRKIGLK